MPTPAQVRDELTGARKVKDVVTVTPGYGDDPLLNYNYGAMHAWTRDALRQASYLWFVCLNVCVWKYTLMCMFLLKT